VDTFTFVYRFVCDLSKWLSYCHSGCQQQQQQRHIVWYLSHNGYIMLFLRLLNCLMFVCWSYSVAAVRYTPDWNSLDSRPLPQWYDDAKVGIFLHWGVFSSPSYGVGSSSESSFLWLFWQQNVSEIVQYIKDNYPPGFTYADFAATFHAELFNPDQWADIIQSAHVKSVIH